MMDLHVVYASDDRFAEIMGVSLTSLFANNAGHVTAYILDGGISEENKQKLESLTCAGKELRWLQAKDISKKLGIAVSVDRGSLSQYARLFVSSALPQGLKRVLYLDCDVLITQSLEELWNIDLHGKTIAALKDAFSKWYRPNIDLEPNDVMFNSGVMLIDLDRWKEQRVEERLMHFIVKKHGRIQQGDQGALNAVLSHDTFCFEPRFNAVTIFFDFSYAEMMRYRKPVDFYPQEQVEEAKAHPMIIHYTTSFLSKRPWVAGCGHRYVDEWLRYKTLSPWQDAPLWPDQSAGGLKGIYTKLCQVMPRSWVIHLSGFMQAYGRPWKNRLLDRL